MRQDRESRLLLRSAGMAALALLVSACDERTGSDQQTGQMVTPTEAPVEPSALPIAAATHVAVAKPGADTVQRVDPASFPVTIAAAPAGPLPARKDFIDPPLPAELKDDGGLAPLPPRPTRTTDR